MDYSIKKREIVYNKFIDRLDKTGRAALKLIKTTFLGKGYQGSVYEYCDKRLCTAVKKIYLENRQARFLKRPFSNPALKYENFIELASMKLTNQIILQRITPHFILNYKSTFKKRDGACDDIYTHSSKFYNEIIDNAESYTDWVKRKHTIKQWYNAYFQITVSLYCLQKYFNMTHLDLHSDNILVKNVKPGGFWKYTINNQDYYVPNYGFVLFINDFGHAWIPDNLQSWIIRKKYKKIKIYKNFDIMKLFQSTLDFSTSPRKFKQQIQTIIKDLEGDKQFIHIIEHIWNGYTLPKNRKIIEVYNLDKSLDTTPLPNELKNLVIY